MNKKFALIGGDKRNILLGDELKKNNHEVIMYGFEKEHIENKMSLLNTIAHSDYIVCGIPFTRDLVNLNAPLSTETINLSHFLDLVPKDKMIFTGAVKKGLITTNKIVDIYKTEKMTEKSTIATSEGAIKIAIEHTNILLYESNVLIIGYGKIGKVLANNIRSLGAKVTIISKSPNSINQATLDGFRAYSSFELERNLSNKNIIFNTAEKIQIDKTNIDMIDKECVYIELASSPFGINYEECVASDIKIIFALSLPGIFSPKTIAKTMCNEIISHKEMIK